MVKLLCGSAALALSAGIAQAQDACTTYTVVAGDNLRFIARSAYGDADLYRVIYRANVDVIGAKADLIEVGAKLVIPCDPDSQDTSVVTIAQPESTGLVTGVVDPATQPVKVVPPLPLGTAEPVATAPTEPAVEPSASDAVASVTEPAPTEVAAEPADVVMTPVKFVTGNGYAPFTDEMLAGGGMFTQLVEMAIFRADPAIPYNMTFISDWQAHIDALLPSQAYDLSFPWPKPDCSGSTMLSPGDQARCDDFVFSAPFYEIVDGFFATAGSDLANANDYSAFVGKRICRPEGYTTGVLDSVGLGMETVKLTRPFTAADCFKALSAGEVDLVSIDAEVGDSAIAELGLTGKFVQNPFLMTLESLHVIAHKSNPKAVQMVVMLDSGLVEMYESGEWYDIVSTALAQRVVVPE
jgi:hypothetical protein